MIIAHNRRLHERHRIELPVALRIEGRAIEGKTHDISLGGVNICLPESIEYGTTGFLIIELPALATKPELPVVVRWADSSKSQVGVQFRELRVRQVWALNELFLHHGKRPARAKSERPSIPHD